MRTVVALALTLASIGCGGQQATETATSSTSQASTTSGGSKQVTFTTDDLDKFERGFRSEIDAVKAAQQKATTATDAQERGVAIQAQWETTTIPQGATASGLAQARYREVREAVDRVFTMLDFQGKIDGPLSIDLERADADTKARVNRDAFADLPADSASALRARMDRLVPLWTEYKKLVAVAG